LTLPCGISARRNFNQKIRPKGERLWLYHGDNFLISAKILQ
jgi:hypothetical protein